MESQLTQINTPIHALSAHNATYLNRRTLEPAWQVHKAHQCHIIFAPVSLALSTAHDQNTHSRSHFNSFDKMPY